MRLDLACSSGAAGAGSAIIYPSSHSLIILTRLRSIMSDFKLPWSFYPPLSSTRRVIRLLHLQPGYGADQLGCRLSVVSLDTHSTYEALSYRWGDAIASILVDGHKVIVPNNLEKALLKIRLKDVETVVWADAICIDQSCVSERNDRWL